MIHLWLKHYVQNRVGEKGKRPGAKENIATFIVSAFWHGFYPFYYVMFFFCAIFNELAKEIFKSKFYFRWIPSPLSKIIPW